MNLSSDEKVSVEKAVASLAKIVDDLHPDLDAQRAAYISFTLAFFRSAAVIAKEQKGEPYARALLQLTEIGKSLILDFYPEGK